MPTDITSDNPKFFKRLWLSLKKALKLTAQIGISGAKVFLGVIIAFGVTNSILIAYAIFKLFKLDFSWPI